MRIAELTELGMPAQVVTVILKYEIKALGQNDSPSARTIERRVARHLKKPPADQLLDAPFSWPASMVNGIVPWEAGPASLHLLAVHQARTHWSEERPRPLHQETARARPTNRLVRWYYRVLQAQPLAPPASPEDPNGGTEGMARLLATWEFVRTEPGYRDEIRRVWDQIIAEQEGYPVYLAAAVP